MAEAVKKKRVKWGRWLLGGLLMVYFAPVFPTYHRELASISGNVHSQFVYHAAQQHQQFSSYDFPNGDARADRARLYLALARFSGIPTQYGRREFMREEAFLWLERGDFERAAYRFQRLADNARFSEGWIYYWPDRYWSMFAFEKADMWDVVDMTVSNLFELGHSEDQIRQVRHAYANLALEHSEYETALEQIHLAYDEERNLEDRVTREQGLGNIYFARYQALGDEADLQRGLDSYETARATLQTVVQDGETLGQVLGGFSESRANYAIVASLEAAGRCDDAQSALDASLNALPDIREEMSCDIEGHYRVGDIHDANFRCWILTRGGRDGAQAACAEAQHRAENPCDEWITMMGIRFEEPPEPLSCPAPTDETP
jgi:hypothetical protein